MPRQPRLIVPDVAVHIVQRGNDRQVCFREEVDYVVYLSSLREMLTKSQCALHAYCLMTNHVHLLVTPSRETSCASLMRDLGQRYVQYFNRRHSRTGTLWEGRFHSCLVDSAAYVLACHRYIERNPVRAGLVSEPRAYRWSSHLGNAGSVEDKLLSAHLEYSALGLDAMQRQLAYRRLFEEVDEPEFLAAVRDATNGGYALVGDRLKAVLTVTARRRLERGKPGPKSEDRGREDSQTGELGL
jgi:putative transposase